LTFASPKRYAMRQDGSYYCAHLEKVFQQRREAALKAMDDAGRQQAAETTATSGYLLAARPDSTWQSTSLFWADWRRCATFLSRD